MLKLLACLAGVTLWAAVALSAEPRRIALTFDDAPRPDTAYLDGATRATKLLAALAAADVAEAVFFCNSKRMDASGTARLRAYADAGHLIANHSHSHADLHRVGVDDFLREVRIADEALHELPTYRRWFRFPYLHEGRTLEERDSVRAWLKRERYLSAYVTVDNYDWHMDALFQAAIRAGKKVDFDRLREAYVELLTESIEFYDRIAREQLQRSPAHVLLLHENDLAALYSDDLVYRLRSRGWQIVSATEAYADPIAQAEPDTLVLGQGRVIALAVASGYDGPSRVWEDEAKIEAEFRRRQVWQ